MGQTVRVGFVGARFAAKFHWEAVRRVYGVPVEIVGVTSKTPGARDGFARDTGTRAFDSFGELCAAVDVVDLCTPPSSHEELAVQALRLGKHVIIEKPLTGYYGASNSPKLQMLAAATASCSSILNAAQARGKRVCYAENWVYAPAIQKEREIIQKSGAQILRILGEQSHSGSHSPYYGKWKFSGGGSLVGKGCHPLSAALYLKRVEGEARAGAAIRPATVSCRTHELTRLPNYRDEGFLRTGYDDIEDYAQIHIQFTDGTVADIFSSEVVMGGVYNWMEIFCNNHRTRCNMNPVNAVESFNPQEDIFKDIYTVEKISTKQGWSNPAPDEGWQHGYPQEFQDFMESVYHDREPLSGIELARDTIATIYAGYLSAEQSGAEVPVPD
jgi:predicted dehydrogenase